MKVIVFGATGTVGRLATAQMLEAGHDVTAFARHPENLPLRSAHLTLAQGDALDAARVEEAVRGHDAVVIALGAGASRRSTIRSRGTLTIIRAMQATGVRRLICQSTLGAHESWSNLNFFWKRIMFGLLLRPVFLDHELQEQLVRASGLNWTIVRPSAFTDGPALSRYKEGFGPAFRKLSLKISRADVAGFLTRQLGDATYLQRAVAISD
ncbi:Putative NADH-flavin reductase [Cribrihabitans marinus]|uniref:Putative NADH-flavin reductase n=1 Tax=Cribrihabitans marinus TaxID=1227549 RepID=A0A1H6TVH6_9RHOB|nr:SDR family oxidoreductase [Cribrihabitans marinus]GGH21750.1 NmrA family transcriptional regulator [Cribrihabitans marinus]SEI79742.1 Putative NADH-flavin reductase [Cribrihabitans marinus]